MTENLSELDKLEKYLKTAEILYERVDEDSFHQIRVYHTEGRTSGKKFVQDWDAICHPGSYGYENGLIEVMGSISENGENDVEGYLTADEIINRIKGTNLNKYNNFNYHYYFDSLVFGLQTAYRTYVDTYREILGIYFITDDGCVGTVMNDKQIAALIAKGEDAKKEVERCFLELKKVKQIMKHKK